MGMLYELQLKYSVQGADDVDKSLAKVKTGVSAAAKDTEREVSKAEQHLQRLATAAENMAQRFGRAMTLAKAAGTAFLAGKALSGIAGMVGQNPEAAQWSDYNKLYGTDPRQFKDHYKSLRRTLAGVDSVGYGKALFDTSWLSDHPELRKRAVESTYMLKKALGPGTTTDQASDLMRKTVGGLGAGKSAEELTDIMEKLPGQLKTVIGDGKARGHDVAVSLPHVAGIYGSKGKSAAEMIVDLGLMGEAFGERAGEIQRNLLSRQGTGYGGLMADLDKQLILQRQFHGARSEAELSDEQRHALRNRLKRTEEKWAEIGSSLLLHHGPEALFKATADGIRQLRELSKTRGVDVEAIISKHYGETASQGMDKFLKEVLSGRRAELIAKAESKTPEQMKHDVHASEQSLVARGDIFQQRVQDAWGSVKSTFWGALADQYDAYGGFFDKISDLWDRHSSSMSSNIRGFVGEFGSAFGQAFGGLPDIGKRIDDLVEKLKGGDPAYWKDLGRELGKIAATDVQPLVAAFRALINLLETATPILNFMAGTLGFLKDTGEWLGKEWHRTKEIYRDPEAFYQRKAYEEMKKSNKSVLDLPDVPAALPEGYSRAVARQNRIPANVVRPRDILDNRLNRDVEAQLQASGAAPPAEAHVNNQITVELDGDEIAARINERVRHKLQDEQDRAGRTAGSRFR